MVICTSIGSEFDSIALVLHRTCSAWDGVATTGASAANHMHDVLIVDVDASVFRDIWDERLLEQRGTAALNESSQPHPMFVPLAKY